MSEARGQSEPSLARTFQGAFEVGCAIGGTLPESLSETERALLTRHFSVRLFAGQRSVTRVSFWGLNDGKSWLNSWPGKRTNHPLLFDRGCRPKPAFWRVVEVIQSRA